MNYEKWRELASEYMEGTLPPDRLAEVRAFLAQDERARADVAALQGISHALKQLPSEEPPLFFADNVRTQIERELAAQKSAWWHLPNLGRLAVGSLLTGGALAAVAWSLLYPTTTAQKQANVLGGATTTANKNVANAPVPELQLGRPALFNTGKNAALDFPVTLTHASHGSVVASVPGGKPTGLFFEEQKRSQVLRVPIAENAEAVRVRMVWTGDSTKGEKWVIFPLVAKGDAKQRLSFSQGELPLVEALALVASRYGQPLILSDLPSNQRLYLDASQETLVEMLTRHVKPLGLTVAETPEGIVVAPATK